LKGFSCADESGLPGDVNLASHGVALTKKSTVDLNGAAHCDEDVQM
jgi:hypothetical protein